jgi:hypothetical protein
VVVVAGAGRDRVGTEAFGGPSELGGTMALADWTADRRSTAAPAPAVGIAIEGSGGRTTAGMSAAPLRVFVDSSAPGDCAEAGEGDGGAGVDTAVDPAAEPAEPAATNLMTPADPAARSAAANSNQGTIPPLRAERPPLDWVFEIGGAVRSAAEGGASEVAAWGSTAPEASVVMTKPAFAMAGGKTEMMRCTECAARGEP